MLEWLESAYSHVIDHMMPGVISSHHTFGERKKNLLKIVEKVEFSLPGRHHVWEPDTA